MPSGCPDADVSPPTGPSLPAGRWRAKVDTGWQTVGQQRDACRRTLSDHRPGDDAPGDDAPQGAPRPPHPPAPVPDLTPLRSHRPTPRPWRRTTPRARLGRASRRAAAAVYSNNQTRAHTSRSRNTSRVFNPVAAPVTTRRLAQHAKQRRMRCVGTHSAADVRRRRQYGGSCAANLHGGAAPCACAAAVAPGEQAHLHCASRGPGRARCSLTRRWAGRGALEPLLTAADIRLPSGGCPVRAAWTAHHDQRVYQASAPLVEPAGSTCYRGTDALAPPRPPGACGLLTTCAWRSSA